MAKTKKAVVAKAVTGVKAQTAVAEAPVQDIKATTVERPERDLGFVDYSKCRDVVLEGKFQIRGILVGAEKKRHWIIQSVNAEGKPGKWIMYIGERKDGKGCYARSELKVICSELPEKAEAKVVETVVV
jgi:hypothetical protein